MKKIISLLLALVMLCGTAAAEGAYQITLDWESVLEGTKLYLQRTTDSTDSQIDQLAQAMSEMAEKSGVQLNVQDNGIYMALSLMDTLLLDMGIFSQEEETVFTSTLLPGRYMSFPESLDAVLTSPEDWLVLDETDFESVLMDVVMVCLEWSEDIEGTEEYGNFVGDAYEGGAHRRSFSFDDSDVASLLDKLLDVLDQHGIDDAMLAPITSDAPFASLRAKNQAVAEANRFQYVLHLVADENGNFVGLSLVVMEAETQVTTFSFATAANGIRFVWGYGMNDQNYYIDGVFIDDGSTEDTFAVAYSLTVYQDPYRLGFSAVEEYFDYVAMMFSGSLKVQPGEEKTTWTADVEIVEPASLLAETRYVVEGEYLPSAQTVDQKLSWYICSDTGEMVLCETITLHAEPCQPMEAPTEGLTAMDMADDGSFTTDDLDLILEEGAQTLVINLFRLLPAPILTFVLQ